MKKIMLATVATIALSLPAMAQSNHMNTMQPNGQSQMGQKTQTNGQANGASQSARQQQAQNRVNPSQLSTQQIRRIQISLNKQGFDTHKVDGKWGPETANALKNFQHQQKLQGSGHLNQQTLAALGVNQSGQARQGSATTGSGSGSGSQASHMNQPSQNPGRMNTDTTGQSSPSATPGTGTGGQRGTSSPAVNDGH